MIGHLFSEGKSFSAYPIKVLYVSEGTSFDLKAGVTVSSRSFKKAVDRNKIKRVLRETYRLQQLPLQNLLNEQNKSLVLFFIYTGKELPAYADIYKSMEILLNRLVIDLSKPE